MHTNRLGSEKSPYLLQHKDNPVAWYAWGEEAFEAARLEQKPIFLSIGYSTCYWCHVMEKDSFETQQVADVLNAHFIAVKVDREERPDVDQLYMQAVMSLTGHGGWPMSVFLTPQLEPFWGGTFFYRDQFIQILNRVHDVWTSERDKVHASAQAVTQFLREHDSDFEPIEVQEDSLRRALQGYAQSFDARHGGFGAAPKFPPSAQVSLLLRLWQRFHEPRAEEMAVTTLREMAHGGLYDHVGGGFHRYSTDERWLVPHFEKMLYDNALLATTYLEAAQVLQDPLYRGVARGTLEYLLRDMRSPDGAFYTAEDAGEVGKEGEFYVWTEAELAKLLPSDQFAALKAAYPVSSEGNFEQGQNILTLNSAVEWQRRDSGLVQQALQTIFEARTKRTRPHLDDKVLSGWNGLVITALCKGFQVLRDSRYLAAAQECAHFIRRAMTTPDELLRRYRAGEAKFSAGLEEYAYVIEGLLNLYACDFDERWLIWAKELQGWQDRKLWDVERGGYFFSDSPELLQRRKEYIDGATPSGNSVAAMNCLRLYAFFGELEYLRRAEFILKAASGGLARYPTAFPKALQALDTMLAGPREIAIVRGSKDQLGKQLCDFLFESFLPHAVWMLVDAESASATALPLLRDRVSLQGRTTVYVCQKQTCGLPLTDFDEVQAAITRGEPA